MSNIELTTRARPKKGVNRDRTLETTSISGIITAMSIDEHDLGPNARYKPNLYRIRLKVSEQVASPFQKGCQDILLENYPYPDWPIMPTYYDEKSVLQVLAESRNPPKVIGSRDKLKVGSQCRIIGVLQPYFEKSIHGVTFKLTHIEAI